MSFRVTPSAHFCSIVGRVAVWRRWACARRALCFSIIGIKLAGYWNKTGRMIVGVFGEAIDKFDVRVVGNHFALEIEA